MPGYLWWSCSSRWERTDWEVSATATKCCILSQHVPWTVLVPSCQPGFHPCSFSFTIVKHNASHGNQLTTMIFLYVWFSTEVIGTRHQLYSGDFVIQQCKVGKKNPNHGDCQANFDSEPEHGTYNKLSKVCLCVIIISGVNSLYSVYRRIKDLQIKIRAVLAVA